MTRDGFFFYPFTVTLMLWRQVSSCYYSAAGSGALIKSEFSLLVILIQQQKQQKKTTKQTNKQTKHYKK